jgi:hypothetical protein
VRLGLILGEESGIVALRSELIARNGDLWKFVVWDIGLA